MISDAVTGSGSCDAGSMKRKLSHNGDISAELRRSEQLRARKSSIKTKVVLILASSNTVLRYDLGLHLVECDLAFWSAVSTFSILERQELLGFESELVRELRNLGAVRFCKIRVPTTPVACETFNKLIGYVYSKKIETYTAKAPMARAH